MAKTSSPHLLFFADACSVHTRRWVGAMVERGWRCSVVSRLHRDIVGAEVHALETPDGSWPWFAALPRVRALAQGLRPDLVHGHYITSYGMWAAASGRRPLVLTGWGSDILVSPRKSAMLRALTGKVLRRADMLTADSADMLAEIASYRPGGALHQILWGADTDKFRPETKPAQPFRIVSARAWEPNYNIDVILAATARLVMRTEAAIELHLLGGGPLEPQLRAQCKALKLEGVVHFHGMVSEDEMARLVNSAHVSVSIPRSDATSVSLLESMAAGLPVVVSDLPANRQWIDASGGVLLHPRDEEALARALLDLLEAPELAQSQGRRNREKVHPLASRRAQMDHMDALYRALLEKA
jgi:glycosyltransferase involved in cell wall biosynthesis